MFGCKFDREGDSIGTVTGQIGSIVEGKNYPLLTTFPFSYYGGYPNTYMDEISSNDGKIIYMSDLNKGCGVTYEGESGNYRALHSGIIFNIIRTEPVRDELMEIYMDYLLNGTPINTDFQGIPQINNISSVFISSINKENYLNFSVSSSSTVEADIFNISGKLISNIFNQTFAPGTYMTNITNITYSNGVYILQLKCDEEMVSKRIQRYK